jgi:hypothetical protein
MTEWRYSNSVASKRAATLLAPVSIGEIASRIAGEMEMLCCHFENCGDNADFGRVVYCFRVSGDLFDVFFNSRYGYRGAYFQSPGQGIDANAAFIAAVAPNLMKNNKGEGLEDDLEWVRESLAASSAKVWIAENGLHLCPKVRRSWVQEQRTQGPATYEDSVFRWLFGSSPKRVHSVA